MPSEQPFDFIATEDPSVLSFWVLVNNNEITATNMPTRGVTTFGELKLNVAARPHSSYDGYFYVNVGAAATPGFQRFYFAKSATSTTLSGEEYQSDGPLPPDQFVERAVIGVSNKIVPQGTDVTTLGNVLQSTVEPVNAVVSRFNSKRVLEYDATPLYSWVLDADTGKGQMVMEQAVPAGTLGSTEVAADALFSDVRPVNPHWSIMTTRKTTTLSGVPTVWSKTERSPVLFPRVLISHNFTKVLSSGRTYFQKLLSYTLKAAYNGDVVVTYYEWWQKSAPSALPAVEMLTTGIDIPRLWSPNISIPDCLHYEFSISEPLVIGYNDAYPVEYPKAYLEEVTYRVPATPLMEWPETVVKMDSDRFAGGYRCLRRVIQKPQSVVEGVVVTHAQWVDTGLIFSNY